MKPESGAQTELGTSRDRDSGWELWLSPRDFVFPLITSLISISFARAVDSPWTGALVVAGFSWVLIWLSLTLHREIRETGARRPSGMIALSILLLAAILATAGSSLSLWHQLRPTTAPEMLAAVYSEGTSDSPRIYAISAANNEHDCGDNFFLLSTDYPYDARQPSWSPRRTDLVYAQLTELSYWRLRRTSVRWREEPGGFDMKPQPGDSEWLTDTTGYHDFRPYWSPSGRYIAFLRARGEPGEELDSLREGRVDLRILDTEVRNGASSFSLSELVDEVPVRDLHGWMIGEEETLIFTDASGRVWHLSLNPSGSQPVLQQLPGLDLQRLGSEPEFDLILGPERAIIFTGRVERVYPREVVYVPDYRQVLSDVEVALGPGIYERNPAASADGENVAYLKWRNGHYQVFRGRLDGQRLVPTAKVTQCPGSFTEITW